MGLQWATKNFTVWKHWTAKQLFKQMNNNFNAITHKELTWWKIFLFLIIAYTRWEFPKAKETQLKKGYRKHIQYAKIICLFLLWLFSYISTNIDGEVLCKNNEGEMGELCSLFLWSFCKGSSKVCAKIHSFSNHISLEKRALFLQTFVTKCKFVLITSYCSGH